MTDELHLHCRLSRLYEILKKEIIFCFVLVYLSVRRLMKLKVRKKKIKSILPFTYTTDSETNFCSVRIVRQNLVQFILLLSQFKDEIRK
jgi:hypothetical protein